MSDNMLEVIGAATRAANPYPLDAEGRLYTVVVPGSADEAGSVKVIDVEEYREKFRDAPRRKTGSYKVHDAESFVRYFSKHSDTDSEVWADTIGNTITGVINAHHGTSSDFEDMARFEDHRVVYAVQKTEAWNAWLKYDGQLVGQAEFAEHLEDRALDIFSPAAADMLELAQTFQATIGVRFERSERLTDGQRQFEYREQVDAKAGRAGRMEIPESFVIAVQPFEGADAYKVKARLRYRINEGTLRLGYKLERPTDVLRDAFLGVVGKVSDGLDPDVPMLRGSR